MTFLQVHWTLYCYFRWKSYRFRSCAGSVIAKLLPFIESRMAAIIVASFITPHYLPSQFQKSLSFLL
jgi:hypothetical protein